MKFHKTISRISYAKRQITLSTQILCKFLANFTTSPLCRLLLLLVALALLAGRRGFRWGTRAKRKVERRQGGKEVRGQAGPGRSHRSLTERGVGCEGQEKRWEVACGATPQEGQRGSGVLPILSRKLLRDEQNPERSWARVVR